MSVGLSVLYCSSIIDVRIRPIAGRFANHTRNPMSLSQMFAGDITPQVDCTRQRCMGTGDMPGHNSKFYSMS